VTKHTKYDIIQVIGMEVLPLLYTWGEKMRIVKSKVNNSYITETIIETKYDKDNYSPDIVCEPTKQTISKKFDKNKKIQKILKDHNIYSQKDEFEQYFLKTHKLTLGFVKHFLNDDFCMDIDNCLGEDCFEYIFNYACNEVIEMFWSENKTIYEEIKYLIIENHKRPIEQIYFKVSDYIDKKSFNEIVSLLRYELCMVVEEKNPSIKKRPTIIKESCSFKRGYVCTSKYSRFYQKKCMPHKCDYNKNI